MRRTARLLSSRGLRASALAEDYLFAAPGKVIGDLKILFAIIQPLGYLRNMSKKISKKGSAVPKIPLSIGEDATTSSPVVFPGKPLPGKKPIHPRYTPAYTPTDKLDLGVMEKMAEEQCTAQQIAACMGCHEATVHDLYGDLLRKGKDKGRRRLIAAMWKKALIDEDTKMQIWLSKQYLGYKDIPQLEQTQIVFNITVNEVPK